MDLKQALDEQPIFYVTRDIERALGLPLDTPGYFIISNATPFAKEVSAGRDNVLLIDERRLLDTWELLEHEKAIIPETPPSPSPTRGGTPGVVVFKNTPQIETICQKNNWHLLNPPVALSAQVEEKISQVEWLGNLAKYLPTHRIDICKNIHWENRNFILQFNRAHTGLGTILVTSDDQLLNLKKKFPNRPVRVTDYIAGPMFTSNNVVTHETVLVGNINYQITGLPPFTDQPFATIGNDWALPQKLLSETQKKQYAEIAKAVGLRLMASGWRGLFGIDVVLDQTTGKLYLIEINARQPASTSFESQIQQSYQQSAMSNRPKAESRKLKASITTFEAHLASLLNLNLNLNLNLTPITDGSQIILRVQGATKNKNLTSLISHLQSINVNVIEYTNNTPGSDLLRIQSPNSIMTGHNQFNNLGQMILQYVNNNYL